MNNATLLSLAGIISLTIILIACLFQGIDHAVVAGITAIIAGLAGYEIRAKRAPSQEP